MASDVVLPGSDDVNRQDKTTTIIADAGTEINSMNEEDLYEVVDGQDTEPGRREAPVPPEDDAYLRSFDSPAREAEGTGEPSGHVSREREAHKRPDRPWTVNSPSVALSQSAPPVAEAGVLLRSEPVNSANQSGGDLATDTSYHAQTLYAPLNHVQAGHEDGSSPEDAGADHGAPKPARRLPNEQRSDRNVHLAQADLPIPGESSTPGSIDAASLPPVTPFSSHAGLEQNSVTLALSNLAHHPPTYVMAGAPGTSTEARNHLPPPPAGVTTVSPAGGQPKPPSAVLDEDAYARAWERFNSDEKRYLSNQRWDKFPEGSRLFIGNLLTEKASRRHLFDLFHPYGRIAQISMKSAFGFVQFHTAEEARAAHENLQGASLSGRKLQIEISHPQKKDGRGKSPDRNRRTGKSDQSRRARDEYRPGKHSPPQLTEYRPKGADDSHGRDRGYHEFGRPRGRSRSPRAHGEYAYSQRSPSPRRYQGEVLSPWDRQPRVGMPVPDILVLAASGLRRHFVEWVEKSFEHHGLIVYVRDLDSSFNKESLVKRELAAGVRAVVDLDLRAEQTAKMSVYLFKSATGIPDDVQYEFFTDLEPAGVTGLVLAVKSQLAQQQGYIPKPEHTWMMHPQTIFPNAQYNLHPMAAMSPHAGPQDPSATHSLYAAHHTHAPRQAPPPPLVTANATAGAASSDIDVHAILERLKNGRSTIGPTTPTQFQHAAQEYMVAPTLHGVQPTDNSNNAATDPEVNKILAQLARFRQ